MSASSPGKLTRQQLYDLIRESSKDEYILSEMIRLGYWNEDSGKPSLPAELIARKGELEREFQALLKKQQQYQDPQKALKELHKQRKAEALKRREETKQNNNEARYQRAVNWHNKNQAEITYLGEDFSAGLQGSFTDRERLTNQELPVIDSSLALAKAMGISINELRFLSFGRKTSKTTHYQQFLIEKKTGGTRRISAPMPRLKRLQYWILGNILEKLPLHDTAHGFVAQRSIVTNAKPHVGADVVVNMDLKDFFPTVTYKRIKGLFCKLGYSEQVATVLALLCSEPEIDEVELDGETFYVARGERYLPQGAPTSPAISNLLCRNLDRRVFGASKKLDFTYTRYADDLTFSGTRKSAHQLRKLLWRVEQIVIDEGFVVHPDKTRIMRKNARQEVTGLVVNQKLSVDRKTLKQFRALLFQIEKDGIEGKVWGKGQLIPSIEGYANFVAMVNPEKGLALQKRVTQIKKQYGFEVKPGKLAALNKKIMRVKATRGEAPREDWWQAEPKPSPVKENTAEQLKAQKKAKAIEKKEAEQSLPEHSTNEQREIENTEDTNNIGTLMIYIAIGLLLIVIFLGS